MNNSGLVIRDSKFLDAEGKIDWEKWAPNGGRVPGTIKEGQTLPAGTIIDRYGNKYGKYTSPVGVPYEQRAFREIFGRTVICGEDEMTLEAYIRTLETDSEFDIEYYCPEKEWISELLSIGSFGIKNLYDGMAGYDIITGEHLSRGEKKSRFIWGIIETAVSIFLAVAAATGLLGKISSKLSQKISPLMEKLEPYIKPYITKIDDAVGQLQRQISQAVQKTGGVVDDTFRLEPVAGETIETLGKEVVQESGEAAGREILQEGSETVETIQSSLDVKEEVQTVVADEVKIGGEGGLNSGLLDELANSGVKYNPDDVVAITKNADGKLVWLENGNSNAGLEHIMQHADQFATKGISSDKIPDFIMHALEEGKVVGTQRTRTIYEVMYEGKLQRVAISVGDNGFIVGANPKSIP